MLVFARPLTIQGLPAKLVSESLQNRRYYQLNPLIDDMEQITAQFCQICSLDPSMELAGLYMISSHFLPFFPLKMTRDLSFFNFVVSGKTAEDNLIAMLCTNDLSRYVVPELGTNTSQLESRLNQVFDGVAVVVDRCFADEESAVREGTKALIKAKGAGRKFIASISDKVGRIANQLEEGSCISVQVESDLSASDVQTVMTASLRMEAVIIDLILRNSALIHSILYPEDAKAYLYAKSTRILNWRDIQVDVYI